MRWPCVWLPNWAIRQVRRGSSPPSPTYLTVTPVMSRVIVGRATLTTIVTWQSARLIGPRGVEREMPEQRPIPGDNPNVEAGKVEPIPLSSCAVGRA